MKSIRNGLLAGLFAGLLLVGLLFIDDKPGKQLVFVAEWFGLGSVSASAWAGALVLLVLGALLGGLLGIILRRRIIPLGRLLLLSLGCGVFLWLVVVLLLANVVQRLAFSTYTMLLYLALSLLYGAVLGSLYARLEGAGR